MFKFFSAFRKEWLILIRDVAGLIILFLMPMVMVVILALVQEFGWNAISKEPKIPVLFVDNDHDSLASQISAGLVSSGVFDVFRKLDTAALTEDIVRSKVVSGDYQIGIVIPKGATQKIRTHINLMVAKTMSGISIMNPALAGALESNDSVEITIFFDPAVKKAFRTAVLSSMKEFRSKIESAMIFQAFNKEIGRIFPAYKTPEIQFRDMVVFQEINPSGRSKEVLPTTTQHNVPAWAVFAMFFIVIPLTSSMIQEREQGHLVRILNLPVSYITIFMAKVGVYLIVCFIQFILMILAGIYFLPLFGIPHLDLGHHYFALFIMALTTSLAALGYGIMIGTIARTHQQSAAFGSVSVIIMAALGGLWVPIYLMPEFMRHAATYSPLNWALAGFYDIFLRGAPPMAIAKSASKLLVFFLVTIGIAGLYRKLKPPITA